VSRLRAVDLKDELAARLTRNRVEGVDLQVVTRETILADG
jgi:hypothetical protein